MNHQDILLSNEHNIFVVTMITVAMVTMAAMEMSIFGPQNHKFGPGAIASKRLHEIYSLIFVYIGVLNLAILGVFQFIALLRKY